MLCRNKYFELYYPNEEYLLDIDRTLREQESKRANFYRRSPQIESRPELLEKLRTAFERQELSRVTLHLSVYFMDIFMDNHNINDERLDLVAFVSLLLGAKVEENEIKVPKLAKLNSLIADISPGSSGYPLNDFVALERMVLNFFDYQVLVPTAATFCEYFMKVVVTHKDAQDFAATPVFKNKYVYFSRVQEDACNYLFEFLDLTLYDSNICQDVPSKVAAACVLAARRSMELSPLWPKELQKITRYKYKHLVDTMCVLLSMRSTKMSGMKGSKRKKETPDSGFLSDIDIEMQNIEGQPPTKKSNN